MAEGQDPEPPKPRELIFVAKVEKCSRISTSDVPKEIPHAFVEIKFPGNEKIKSPSIAMAAASDGNPEHYPFNLEKEFKVELTREALHALINEPVVVSVGMDKKDFKACIKEIDLLDLVLGRQKNVAIPEDPLPGPGVEGNWAEQVTLFGVSIEVAEMVPGEEGAEPVRSQAWVMTPEEGEAATVLSLTGLEARNVPAAISTAAAKVGEGNTWLRVSAVLPIGPKERIPLVVSGIPFPLKGRRLAEIQCPMPRPIKLSVPIPDVSVQVDATSFNAETLTMTFPDKPVRYLLPSVKYLQTNLDDGCRIAVEIARAFPPHLKVDDLGDMHWRCVAPVDLASLVEPGRAETDLECPALLPLHDALTSLGPNFTESSLGPRRTAAEGKDVVKIEDDTGGRCPFVEASTVVVIRLSLSSPLLPPWERPVPPDQSLDDVVPPKAPPPPSPAKTATEAFREECRRVIGELTRDYEAVAESSPEVGITPAVLWQARQKKLKYELNRSGKFLAIRGALKKHVEAVVSERFGRSGEMAPQSMADVYNSLYTVLCDEMRQALKEVYDPEPVSENPPPTEVEREAMLRLAEECEKTGRLERAEQLHQDRLVECESAKAWVEYAAFSARNGNSRRASESFKKALEINPDDPDVLLRLCFVLMDLGFSTDPLHFRHAEVIVHSLLGTADKPGLGAPGSAATHWAILASIARAIGPGRAKDFKAALHETRKAVKSDGRHVRAAFLDAASMASDLRLGTVALGILEAGEGEMVEWGGVQGGGDKAGGNKSATIGTGDGVPADVVKGGHLVRAWGNLSLGRHAEALEEARKAGQMTEGSDVTVNIIKGHVYHAVGKANKASQQYMIAVREAPADCPLEVFLRLSETLDLVGAADGALKVLLTACKHVPCSTVWEQVGIKYFKTGVYDKADMALAQANVMDPKNPSAWAWMAAVQLSQEQQQEAETCLRYALKYGLNDSAPMIELARQYIHLGKFDAAVSALRRTVSSRDDPEAHLLLGEVLLEANEMEAAAKSLRAAIAAAKKAVDEAPAPLAADGGEEGDGEGEEAVAGDSAVERAKATYETVEGRVRELLANVH